MVRVVAAELIVVVHLDSSLRQKGFHSLKVLMTETGTSMQQKHFDRTVPHAFGPHLVLSVCYGKHANACGVNAWWIQIVGGVHWAWSGWGLREGGSCHNGEACCAS